MTAFNIFGGLLLLSIATMILGLIFLMTNISEKVGHKMFFGSMFAIGILAFLGTLYAGFAILFNL